MARHPRSVDAAIARFDEMAARLDGHVPAGGRAALRRYGRSAGAFGRRLVNMGMALAVLIAATIGFGLFVAPIGWTGLFVVAMLTMCVMVFFSSWPSEPKRVAYSEQMPTKQVVQQLDSYLVRQRAALPAPAARRVDAIGSQLPLLEAKLASVDPLDPLAQDARRLMGKHLPDLIERYERVPAAYRHERDGEGLTVDERLVTSLDAAQNALGEIGARLAKQDLDAFETQGRFIESRYKSDGEIKGE
ncbi:hypothetical protein SH591_03460 [Sphingomonas sp. LY54]|uniref:hypothetical protein n=1 Tax=Sphingomonas sp. LY54 TaxID=3095343 RepID=UPI002D779EE4|nr:hypothetical protein [Sphingomonas sp. LY54]WRP29255.1 hypothetical protein SH591_03460 [Sphingomonas sp. LY54]